MAPTKRNTRGVGGYKSSEHQKKGGGKTNVDPQGGVGNLRDQYKGK